MTTNRSGLIAKVYKVLKKHYKPQTPPEDRTALEHLIYACLLENARADAADEAFAKLKELYFDWNEIRVTTVTELAEGMGTLADASSAAQRVKKSLQSIFEANYSFDIELLKKQNLGKAEKDLEKVVGSSPFVRSYVTQHALAGHSIPVSKGAIDVLYAVGVINDQEADKGLVPGLERAIPKNKGLEFGSLLQQVAADLVASPGSSKLKTVLSEIDGEAKDRLAARQSRVEAAAAAQVVANKQAREKARAEARAAALAAEAKPSKSGKSGDKGGGANAKFKGKDKEKEHSSKDQAGKGKPAPAPAPAAKKKSESPLPEKDIRRSASKTAPKRKPR